MKITESSQKEYLGRLRKGLITSLGINNIKSSNEKKASYAIINVSLKDISMVIKEFDELTL